MTSLSASFTQWRTKDKLPAADRSNIFRADQSVISAISDSLPPTLHLSSSAVHSADCDINLHRPVIAATPVMIRKRRADNEIPPFSTTKK